MVLERQQDKPGNTIASQQSARSRIAGLMFICIGLGTTAPAIGQVFKWTDDQGVTHYSSTPPAKTGTTVKRLTGESLEVPQGKVPAVAESKGSRETVADVLAGGPESLQQQLEAERQARQIADAQNLATQAAYANALAAQQAAQNVGYAQTIPTVSGVIMLPPAYRNHFNNCHSAGAHAANCRPTNNHWQKPVQTRMH